MYSHELKKTSSILNESIPELSIDFLIALDEYGLTFDDLDSYDEEAILETIADAIPGANATKEIQKHLTNVKDLHNQWKKVADKFTMHKWIYRYIKDEKEEELLHKNYDILCAEGNTRDTGNYSAYKKAFKFMCNFFGLPTDGVVIEWFTFDNDKEDKHQKKLSIRYSRGLAKVRVPDGMLLYHASPAKGIDKLIPAFKSKTAGKFMYPNNRVFFTVQKKINPFKFGLGKHKYLPIKDKDVELYYYTPSKPITTVYIDPTYSLKGEANLRSVYVETDSPIPVIDITHAKKDIVGKEKVQRESYNITKSGDMDDIMLESLFKKNNSDADDKEVADLMKKWTTSNQNHKLQVFKNNNLTEEEYDKIYDLYDLARNAEDYKTYKKAFDGICKFCHIVPRGTVITKCEIRSGSKPNNNSITVEYAANTKPLRLPDNMKLYHMSKVADIKELIPVFRGKSSNGYLYDKPRIYFTIHKSMPKFLADYKLTETMHKYECKLNIKDVYVDPLVWNGTLQGAVYVETDKPIPVEEMGIKKKSSKEDEKKEEK
jgi:hypothetical protein